MTAATPAHSYSVYKISLSGLFDVNVGAQIGTGSAVTDSASSPVLSLGNQFHDSEVSGKITYIGTADGPNGAVGFIGYDKSTGQAYLFADHPVSSQNYFLNYSLGPDDPFAGNWNLNTGQAQRGHAPHCFMAGTMIATPAGTAAVETLKHGDLVILQDGDVAPVTWLGRQTVSTLFADKLRVLPIRIKAGALAEGLPGRDLLLSPCHAVLLDDVLVQAGALVNGVSIIRETQVPDTFTYYHVEVANHALVLAEGVPAETFVDNVDRLAFDNWAEHEALCGPAVAIPEMSHPRAKSYRQVPPALRNALQARAERLFGTADLALAS